MRPARQDLLAAEVRAPALDVDDARVPDRVAHGLGHLEDRDVLGAGEVVDAAGRAVAHAEHDALREVLDVDEAPRLKPVAGDRERIAGHRLVGEGGDHGRRAGARAIRDPEAQDRPLHPGALGVGAAVQLAGELGRGVEVLGRGDRAVLVHRRLRAVAVDPDRARVDDPLDAGLRRRAQDGERAAGVDLLSPARIGVELVHVGHRGEVHDGVAAGHGPHARIVVVDRAQVHLDRAVAVVAARARGRGSAARVRARAVDRPRASR